MGKNHGYNYEEKKIFMIAHTKPNRQYLAVTIQQQLGKEIKQQLVNGSSYVYTPYIVLWILFGVVFFFVFSFYVTVYI